MCEAIGKRDILLYVQFGYIFTIFYTNNKVGILNKSIINIDTDLVILFYKLNG